MNKNRTNRTDRTNGARGTARLYLDHADLALLRDAAAECGVSLSTVVRALVRLHVGGTLSEAEEWALRKTQRMPLPTKF